MLFIFVLLLANSKLAKSSGHNFGIVNTSPHCHNIKIPISPWKEWVEVVSHGVHSLYLEDIR